MILKREIFDYLLFTIYFFLSVTMGKSSSLIALVGLLFSTIIFIYYFAKRPVFSFMFSFSIFLNLGNYLPDNSFGLPKFFSYKYYFLVLSFLVVFAPKIKKLLIRDDFELRKLLYIAVLLNLYQIIICIYVHLSPSYVKTILIIIRNFPQIFGIYLILPVYLLVKYNYKDFFYIIVFMGISLLLVFYISILTPLELIEVVDYENRFGITGPKRIYFQGTGFISYCVGFSICLLFFKKKYGIMNKLIFFNSFLYVCNVFLSITRSTIILLGSEIVSLIYCLGVFHKYKFTSYIKKLSIFLLIIILSLLINPKILINVIDAFIISLIDQDISSISRFTYEMPRHINIIQNNLFFGTGFKSFWANYEFGQTDMPFTANIGKYGVFGMLIFSFLYIYSFIFMIKMLKILNKNFSFLIKRNNILYLFLFLSFTIAILTKTVLNPLYFSSDLMFETGMANLGFQFGIIYGSARVMTSNVLFYKRNIKLS